MRRYSFMIIGLLVFCIFGYWSGFGYYIHMAASTILSTDVLNILGQQRNKTEVNETTTSGDMLYIDKINNRTNTSYRASDKITTISTPVTLTTSVVKRVDSKKVKIRKQMCDSVMADNSTVPDDNLSHRYTTVSSFQNKTLYITADAMRDGRLGNQMFRYASLLGIARAQGRTLIISQGSELEDTFRLSHVSTIEGSGSWPTVYEAHGYAFDTRLLNLTSQNYKIRGFLQSFKYFNFAEDEVIQEFNFRHSVIVDACKILRTLLANYTNSLLIGVHVRRGDFLQNDKQILGYGVPDKSYFLKAFNLMKEKFIGRNILFLVASDDFNWCRDNLAGKNVTLLPDASPSVHMAILSNCEHMIISGGTYGWWGGFLSGGQVIYFTGFMRKGTTFGDQVVPENYYPPSWIGLGN